jgi:hypothetical protein
VELPEIIETHPLYVSRFPAILKGIDALAQTRSTRTSCFT